MCVWGSISYLEGRNTVGLVHWLPRSSSGSFWKPFSPSSRGILGVKRQREADTRRSGSVWGGCGAGDCPGWVSEWSARREEESASSSWLMNFETHQRREGKMSDTQRATDDCWWSPSLVRIRNSSPPNLEGIPRALICGPGRNNEISGSRCKRVKKKSLFLLWLRPYGDRDTIKLRS